MIRLLVLLVAAHVIISVAPALYYHLGAKDGPRGKTALAMNLALFVIAFVSASVFIFSGSAFAAEEISQASDFAQASAFIGAALVTGLCCIGTGIAVGSAATAAIGAISENEKVMGKALIFVAMAEGIAIYGLLISFMILGRV